MERATVEQACIALSLYFLTENFNQREFMCKVQKSALQHLFLTDLVIWGSEDTLYATIQGF
jgi:hypothetical protein